MKIFNLFKASPVSLQFSSCVNFEIQNSEIVYHSGSKPAVCQKTAVIFNFYVSQL